MTIMLGLATDYGLAIIGLGIGVTMLALSAKKAGGKASSGTSFTRVMMVLLCVASALEGYKTYSDHRGNNDPHTANIRESSANIEDILTRSISSLEQSSERISEVSDRLWRLNESTDSMMYLWNERFTEGKHMKELLERKVKLEKENLLKDAPQVDLLSYDIKFKKLSSPDYKLVFCPKNLGNRTAENFTDGAIIAFLNSDNQVTHHSTEVNNENDDLHPFEKHGTSLCTHTSTYSRQFIEKEARACMVYYWSHYEDRATNESFFVEKRLIWNGYEVDKTRFNNVDSDNQVEHVFHQYFSNNNLYKRRS